MMPQFLRFFRFWGQTAEKRPGSDRLPQTTLDKSLGCFLSGIRLSAVEESRTGHLGEQLTQEAPAEPRSAISCADLS